MDALVTTQFIREMFIVAGHNAHRIGELGILRQVGNAWGPSHRE